MNEIKQQITTEGALNYKDLQEQGNQMQVFQNSEFGEIRVLSIKGEPWFVGKDVAEKLGYSNTRDALSKHVDELDKSTVAIYDGSQNRNVTVINESGLYSLILSSKLPKAKEFKHWITSEVLPSIRRTGTYSLQTKPDSYMIDDPIERAKRWIEEKEAYLALENKVKQDEPKVAFADKVADASNLIDVGEMAKLLYDENIPIGRNRLFEWLRKEKYLRNNNEPYQKYIDNGMFTVKECTYKTPYGQQVSIKTYITGKGQIFIAETLRKKFGKTA